jgi:hypothetical protein
MMGLAFATPWVLLALPALPLLWWLLRVTPPAPRREVFPAIRLLLGLNATAETPAHTPWWLLALRMLAAALVIVGLARPILGAGQALDGSGPVLLVIDDGWAAAHDWPQRQAAAQSVLDRADRAGRKVALLTTADTPDGAAPSVSPVMPVAELRPIVSALRPKPWPTDRAAATAALQRFPGGAVVYLGDGLAGPADFAPRLSVLGPVEQRTDLDPPVLLLPPTASGDSLTARVLTLPTAAPRAIALLAQTGDGRSLARETVSIPAGGHDGTATFRLPPELRNRLARIVAEGPDTAASQALLDERWRRRPVGLLAGDAATADTPLTGELFYLDRALQPYTELRHGTLDQLLSRELSVLILADHVVAGGPEFGAIDRFVRKGGTLIRFAGPGMAEHPDDLLPVTLLAGDRALGGAMSWTQPPGLAPFDADSPFAGLPVPAEVKVTRQVLAAPASTQIVQRPGQKPVDPVWARLADGTPLVTQARLGAGRIVLFHVTANADWSNLPLSGLFVDMLRRLVEQAAGVAGEDGTAPLHPVQTLDAFGQLGAPNPAATAIDPRAIATTTASAAHPPGLYGPESDRRVLNLGQGIAALDSAAPVPGARVAALGSDAQERPIAPWLIASALALLAIDLLVSLRLRGLIFRPALLALLLLAPAARAQPLLEPGTNPALVTRLAYYVTGDSEVDDIARAGLTGLSDYVNRRTNAALGAPMAVHPGTDDLSFYPLLYWPISANAQPPSGAAVQALNDFMSHGGIILIDTRNGGSGEGFAPGADQALTRFGAGLDVPVLAPLTPAHVLAHSFYLLQDFPGRYDGGTVWVQRDQDRTNDSVSPVIIGGHDWAAAWAIDDQGRNPYATLPGGARQRVLAYRFGVNLVMYALTGNYKGDQVHVPALLERLGQ